MNEEEQEDLRQENQHRANSLPYSIDDKRTQHAVGQHAADPGARGVQAYLEKVLERLAGEKNDLKDGNHDEREDRRSPEAMQKDVVEPLGPDRSGGTAVAGVFADTHRPFAHGAGAADYRQLQRIGGNRGRREKVRDRLETFAGHGAYQSHRSAKFASQGQHVNGAVLLVQFVGHVEQHERGQAEGDDTSGEHEVGVKVVGVRARR